MLPGPLLSDISEILTLEEQDRLYTKAQLLGKTPDALVLETLYRYLCKRVNNVSTPPTGLQ
jgi:hypothetical protein